MSTTLVSARVNQAKREALNPVLEDLGVSFSAFVSDAIDSVLQTKQLPTKNIPNAAAEKESAAARSDARDKDVANFINATTIDIDWSNAPVGYNAAIEQAWLQGDYKSFVRDAKYQDYMSLSSEDAAKE